MALDSREERSAFFVLVGFIKLIQHLLFFGGGFEVGVVLEFLLGRGAVDVQGFHYLLVNGFAHTPTALLFFGIFRNRDNRFWFFLFLEFLFENSFSVDFFIFDRIFRTRVLRTWLFKLHFLFFLFILGKLLSLLLNIGLILDKFLLLFIKRGILAIAHRCLRSLF